MFVNSLNPDQQGIFLHLAQRLIAADGNISDQEQLMLDTLHSQMQSGVVAISTADITKAFPSKRSKVSVLLELLGLAHADEHYHVSEQDFISVLAAQMGISPTTLAQMENWVIRQFALMRETQQLMED